MLSPATGYAAIALGYLAECESGSARVEEIARARDIPAPYLGKIMHALARKGFVRTKRGVGGGVVLACDPREATLLDLCEALDDPATDKRCMLGVAECSDERACPAHAFWTRHRKQLILFASTTTISAIGEFERRRRASSSRVEAAKARRGKAAARRPKPGRPRSGTPGGSR